MDSKKTHRFPLVFRAAAFYAFFSLFFLNAQPIVANWNDPFARFLNRIYTAFSFEETGSGQKSSEEIAPNGVYPLPPPPPPPTGMVGEE